MGLDPRWRWALVGVLIDLAVITPALAVDGPTRFINLGEPHPTLIALAHETIGPDVHVERAGHDGQFVWLMARDPLLLHSAADPANYDRPAYRAQRIGYPLLAAPWRILGEQGLAWGLVLMNLAVIAIGTYLAAGLLLDLGANPIGSLAFAIGPATVGALVADLGDALALAALLACLLGLVRRAPPATIAVGAIVAVLARESIWTSLLALALLVPTVRRDRRLVIALVVAPLAAAGIWGLYARWRLGWPGTSLEEWDIPFGGYVKSWRFAWTVDKDWLDAAIALAMIPLATYAIARWWRRRSFLMSAALPAALMVPFFSAQVTHLNINSLRATGPLVALLVIDVLWERAGSPAALDAVPVALV